MGNGGCIGNTRVVVGETWDAVGETVVIRRRRRCVDRVYRVGYVRVAFVKVGGGGCGKKRNIFDMFAWEWCWGVLGLK